MEIVAPPSWRTTYFRSVSDRTYTVKQKLDEARYMLDLTLPEMAEPTILTGISDLSTAIVLAGH